MKIPDNFTIGALAQAAAVSVETMRFYQRKHLLPEPERPRGMPLWALRGGPGALHQGLPAHRVNLDEVAQLLQLEDGTQCSQAREIAVHKLVDIRQRMSDLQRIDAVLTKLVDRCAARRGKVTCPLISSLQDAT